MILDRNEFFRQAARKICGSLDIEVALKRCFDYVQDFLPAEGMALTIFPHGMKNMMKILVSVSSDGQSELGKLLPVEEFDWAQEAPERPDMSSIKIINRPGSEPTVRKLHQKMGMDLDFSLIIMRLELEGMLVGELGIRAPGNDRFTREDAELVLMLKEPFAIAMANALQHQEVIRLKDMLADDNRYLQRELTELSGSEIIGADFGLRDVMSLVRQVAPMESPVLLLGDTGVGKEVIANAIHRFSPRREGPMIKVNCGAIPDTLIDSELFGHEKGSFTGAVSHKRGRFERANGGTIFLDEIGELPLQAQVRLLHVIQNREIERVGGTQAIPVDIRIISATHRNLEEMIAKGKFREDLWFRLNVFPIMIPPLRQRKEDIPALVHHFIERKGMVLKLKDRPSLAAKTIDRLIAYEWPGNVRELENVVERALIRHHEGALSFDNLLAPWTTRGEQRKSNIPEEGALLSLDEMTTLHIIRALRLARNKISGPGGAAELLKVHPNTLRKKMDRLNIPYGRKMSGL